jgi:hypothetical protein
MDMVKSGNTRLLGTKAHTNEHENTTKKREREKEAKGVGEREEQRERERMGGPHTPKTRAVMVIPRFDE